MPSSKLQVAICTDGIFPDAIGGMQRHSRLLVEELARRESLELHVLHPHPNAPLFSNSVKEYVVKPVDEKANYLRQCYSYSGRIENILQKIEPDVVFSQGLSVWKKRNRWAGRWIIHPHGLEPFQALGFRSKMVARPFRMVFRKLFKSAHTTVSLGGRLTPILKNQQARRVVEIPNATKSPALQNVEESKFEGPAVRLLFVARLEQNKGVHLLLKGVAESIEAGLPLELDVAGSGTLAGLVRSYDRANPAIRFHEGIPEDELQKLYESAHAFVFPTLFEGMPTVVLEAMSAGLPVIVSDTGATAELVTPQNGLLIPRNNLLAFKEALRWFSSASAGEKAVMGNESLNKVRHSFSWPVVARGFEALFYQVAHTQ